MFECRNDVLLTHQTASSTSEDLHTCDQGSLAHEIREAANDE